MVSLTNLNFKFFFIVLLTIISIPVVTSDTSFFVDEGSNYSVRFLCEINDAVCTSSALCNVTFEYPNTTIFVLNQAADLIDEPQSIFEYNITSDQTNSKGEYRGRVACYDGGLNGSDSFIFEVNPTGIRPTEERTQSTTRAIYFLLVISLLLFTAFLFFSGSLPVRLTFLVFSIIFMVATLNIISISLADEVINTNLQNFFDGITVIAFYFYWFAAGILIIMWLFTFLNTWLLKKNLRNLQKFGGEF